MYELVNYLRVHPSAMSAYLFGEYVHFATRDEVKTEELNVDEATKHIINAIYPKLNHHE